MNECEEYIRFVTMKIQNHLDHQYGIQGRNIEDLTGYKAKAKIEALKELAKDIGVEVE